MNHEFLAFNLGEAREQIEALQGELEAGEVDEEALRVGLLHAYHHLNYAWNARNLGDDVWESVDFYSLRKFPAEFIDQFCQDELEDV